MPVESGEMTQLAYVREDQFGTTPATPTGQILRCLPFTLEADANYIENPELRQDSMKAAGRRGALRGKGNFPGKLSYGTYDDFLAAALGNWEWASNVIKVKPIKTMSSASVAVAASGKTFTRLAGSFLTDGFAVGDYVQWAGFTNAGNNITVKITTLTATVMTCSGATGLVDETTAFGRFCSTNTRPSFTTEKGHKLNGIYFPHTGTVIDGFTMAGKVGEAVDIAFNVLSKSVGNESRSSVFSTLTAENTNPLMTGWDGSVKKGGVSIAELTGWTLEVARNSGIADAYGSSNLYDIRPGAVDVKGTLEMWFESPQSYTDYRTEADLALQILLGPGVSKSYQIDLTKCRYTGWKSEATDGMIRATCNLASTAPDSGTNTSIMFTRLP